MNIANSQVRRATVDDLVDLRRLWQHSQLPVVHLEKRLTEFQVVETADGQVLGTIGLRVEQQQAEIHSEALSDPALEAELRSRLWERVQSVARNHRLNRLWITNVSTLFWLDQGFEAADSELLAKRPSGFRGGDAGRWLTLKLRDEPASLSTADAELELFRLAQKEETARIIRRAQTLRWAAVVIAGFVLVLVGLAAFYVVGHMNTGRAR